jgi:hypothetical protein
MQPHLAAFRLVGCGGYDRGGHAGGFLAMTNSANPIPPRVLPVDSKEGIKFLFEWARAGGFVLSEYHEAIAAKHGVPTAGVVISRPLPQYPNG